MAVSRLHSPSTDGRSTNTDPRTHHSPCAGCWAPGQPHIGCMVSRRNCTRTSPSVTGTTRTPSYRQKADCPHHTARTRLLPQTRTHCRQRSTAGIRCDQREAAILVHTTGMYRPAPLYPQGTLRMQSLHRSAADRKRMLRSYLRLQPCQQSTQCTHSVLHLAALRHHTARTVH